MQGSVGAGAVLVAPVVPSRQAPEFLAIFIELSLQGRGIEQSILTLQLLFYQPQSPRGSPALVDKVFAVRSSSSLHDCGNAA